ncbi:unnamed protein product [Ectocarpus sp. 13 AM-2016]
MALSTALGHEAFSITTAPDLRHPDRNLSPNMILRKTPVLAEGAELNRQIYKGRDTVVWRDCRHASDTAPPISHGVRRIRRVRPPRLLPYPKPTLYRTKPQ